MNAAQLPSVNFSPGVIDTPINDGNPEKMNQVLVQSTPLRRMGEPGEIAEAALFLASDESRHVNGAEMVIDNAYTAA